MTWLITLVGSKLATLVAGVLAALGTILLAFGAGKSNEKKNQKIKDLETYKKTREKIDEVPTNTDVDAAIKRLRRDGGLRD